MNNEEQKFEQQDHPLKNTDRAFVKVGKDGAPVIPEQREEGENATDEGNKQNITYDRP